MPFVKLKSSFLTLVAYLHVQCPYVYTRAQKWYLQAVSISLQLHDRESQTLSILPTTDTALIKKLVNSTKCIMKMGNMSKTKYTKHDNTTNQPTTQPTLRHQFAKAWWQTILQNLLFSFLFCALANLIYVSCLITEEMTAWKPCRKKRKIVQDRKGGCLLIKGHRGYANIDICTPQVTEIENSN